MTITTSPPPSSRRRRVTARRMADTSGASTGRGPVRRNALSGSSARREHAPDALCHQRQLETESRFLELARPLRSARPQHDPAAEAEREEGRLPGVTARGRDPAGAARKVARGLEDGELA